MKWKGRPRSANVEDRRLEHKLNKGVSSADTLVGGVERLVAKGAKAPPGYEFGPFKADTFWPPKQPAPAAKLTQMSEKRNATALHALAMKHNPWALNGP